MARRPPATRPARTPAATAARPKPAAVDPAAGFAERLRKLALGLFAALVVARAFWPSEGAASGSGLAWVVAMIGLAGLALAATVFGDGRLIRLSWVDLAVALLIGAVGYSAGHAADRRPAYNLACEWAALGVAYLLARNLPRSAAESRALAGAVAATAVAVSAYGLYQVAVEFPQMHAAYRANPERILRLQGIDPAGPGRAIFEDRLLGSNEAFSTFALANSLAGFLVGPAAVGVALVLASLGRRGDRGGIGGRLALAAVPYLILLACLMMTKSRSAYLGLLVASAVLAWRERRRVAPRTLAVAGASAVALALALVAAGVATGRLDREVLTQSTKSLSYRGEYWAGTWRMIASAPDPTRPRPSIFWRGLGPGNFGNPYLKFKLPESSEEIQDPHNLVLEVWAAAGLPAALLLLAALGLGLREAFGPARPAETIGDASTAAQAPEAPGSAGWLVAWAAGGWVAVLLVGDFNLFSEADLLGRWLILGLGWGLAVALGGPLWRRVPVSAAAMGAATLAIAVNLLAAGGIGMPAVALGLWLSLALGQNLRDDRPSGRPRTPRIGALVVAAFAWSALLGTVLGAAVPFWKCEAAMAEADAALRPPGKFDAARDACNRAERADPINPAPWLKAADVEFAFWQSPESNHDPRIIQRVILALDKALVRPRDERSLPVLRRQIAYVRAIAGRLGEKITKSDMLLLQPYLKRALTVAVQVYPTSAILRAELAEADTGIGLFAEAVREAEEALRLDALTPHPDKKLPDAVRAQLKAELPGWKETAKTSPGVSLPPPR